MPHPLTLAHDLEQHVRRHLGRRVRNLAVECGPGRVVLRGEAYSYHVKQLAQHALHGALPQPLTLFNAITVR